ncbi:Replication factor C subunit 1 [Wickerhamomyces ciferrii]|uniref:Replication factor C subunit 1 n=1 Tax=Wickerhamomyces ciferrii (strain ATCC 14091 / BCRC 22168 / CBS 111 / JCM 3599 / NBRC 0793 / NRRL Y-1031 F-60-10) TaxID=1206466 RepID=K0KJ95_WICCF|nr:Replication factor C subunit 1 [Wickerhamomyces ciferrii]CCH41183.1 Replication factor C subunit 1 [Wickerhamomyces ciferrii]
MVDIRDFFGNKKGGSAKTAPKTTKQTPAKRSKTIAISDDDEDDIVEVSKPKRAKTEGSAPTKSEHFTKKESKAPSTAPAPVKSTPKEASKPKKKSNDDDFVVSDDDFIDLDDEDDDFFAEELKELDNLPKDRTSTRTNTTVEDKPTPPPPAKSTKAAPQTKAKPAPKPSPKKKSPAPAKSSVKSSSGGGDVTALDVLAKITDADLPEDIPTGEGFNYHAFKARQNDLPVQTGAFEIPEGAPNCLTGLTIVFTGVLPNIPRDDAEGIAKKYGAKVTKSISSKTTVVVLGEEAGPSKVRKIKQLKIKAITEEGFIQLIKGMPEEGGDGAEAEKARARREEEERKAIEESQRMQEEEEAAAKKRDAAIKKAQNSGNYANSSKLKTDSEKLWTVRYAPTNISQICGNKSSVQKLQSWLESWPSKFGNRKPQKGESELRAVLIHGPPGIGKTTAAHLVAKSLGYDVLEKNASDVRSKGLLNSGVGNILNNTSVMGYFNPEAHATAENGAKFCLIMDEVDGMSGGDRGGVGQLASYCRTTQVPMILICNDKSLPKMRPFDRVTIDLPFRRPSAREMKSRLMTIALREKIKLDPNIIDQLVQATSNDIRQIINLLSTVSSTQKTINSENSKDISEAWKKNIALKPFDIIPRLLSGQNYSKVSQVPLFKKMEYYFDDHAFVPLMLQENYLNSKPVNGNTKTKHLELVAKAADSISQGDLVDKKIHSAEQQWSLMPLHAIMSTVRPASFVAGQVGGRINFTGWLGQNSKTGKYTRLLTELQYRSRLRTSTDQTEFRLEYIPLLAKKLLDPLVSQGADGIEETISILDHYYLSKTDWDFLLEFPIGEDSTAAKLKKVATATKSKFTRKYNSTSHPMSIYKPGLSTGVNGKTKKEKPDLDEAPEDDPEPEEDLIDE